MIKPNGLMMCSKVFWNNDCVQRKYVQLMKIWDHKEIRIKTEIRNRFWKNDYNKFNSVTSVIIVLKVCTLFVKIVLKQMKKRRKKPWSLTWRHCSHKYGNKALKYPDFFPWAQSVSDIDNSVWRMSPHSCLCIKNSYKVMSFTCMS